MTALQLSNSINLAGKGKVALGLAEMHHVRADVNYQRRALDLESMISVIRSPSCAILPLASFPALASLTQPRR